MLAVEVIYGFVWCPSCELVERRKKETEPLPRCAECHIWMEVLLCDKCELEATIMVEDAELRAAEYLCEEHS